MTSKDGEPGLLGSSSQDTGFARNELSGGTACVEPVSVLQQHGGSVKPDGSDGSVEIAVRSPVARVASRQALSTAMLDEPALSAGYIDADAEQRADADAERRQVEGAGRVPSMQAASTVSATSGKPAYARQGRSQDESGKTASAKSVTKYAALDLGTNNCRLLIAEPRDQGFRIIDSFSRIVRLGEGISRNNRLGDEAADRAISALRICWNKLKYHKVERVRLIATEACRSAENGAEFLQRVSREIGLDLEIIDQETEARLAVTGCSSLVEPRSDGVVLFDIGGGSSEIVWLDRRGRRKRNRLGGTLRAWASLPVGVVTLSERHDGKNVTWDSFELMVKEVQDMLEAFPKRRELQQALSRGRHHLLGTSGTVTTLAGVHLGLRRYDRRRVDGMWMSNDDAASMIQQLLALSYEERVQHPCIGSDRADLVLPGCAIFEAIRREFSCDQLRVADRGLREGILVELMNKDGHGLVRRGLRSAPWRRKRPKSKTRQTPAGDSKPTSDMGNTSDER
uniref:Ppx/GppA phosphatase family protein n=1 Tax=Pararhizobium sp. IMCC3301 TaxID=3067904 RepID=UPI002740F5E1|nr:Ppx/GppA phosphatase family protein [Pararhizobium sp. IMCC3301]